MGGIASHMLDEDGFQTMLENLIPKFYLYMGHTVQFTNQNNAIKYLIARMNDDSYICVVVIDFKMRFETMKH